MAITKKILNQYLNEKKEIDEIRQRIEYLEYKIPKIEKRIAEIEDGHTVKDKVKGGEGGWQHFVVEGVPYNEWNDKKAELSFKKSMLVQRKKLLETAEMQFLLRTKEVETFISSINDSVTRRIIRLRVLDGYSWKEVAEKMGGSNNENGVKKIYQRYMESNA